MNTCSMAARLCIAENGLSDENSELEPPDPISNSEVKRLSADGSVGVSPCESRTSSGFIETPRSSRRFGAFFYGFFMYAEINQALEALRQNGSFQCCLQSGPKAR